MGSLYASLPGIRALNQISRSNVRPILYNFLNYWQSLHHSLEPPGSVGTIRSEPADFRVDEDLGFSPDGEGTHLWFRFEKTLMNTQDVVSLIARETGTATRDIGFSGQKDRNAVTTQWMSVPVGEEASSIGATVDAVFGNHEQLRLLDMARHHGKLRRGYHRGNRFELMIREFNGTTNDIARRLEAITVKGFPNFFGPQRFGRNGKNLQTAERLFGGDLKRIDRTARSMALSSARAWLFNASVSERLSQCAIDDALIGDALQLDGTQSFFAHDGSDGTVVDRIAARDVHPTGPMWGGGAQPVAGEVAEMESAVAARYPVFAEGLVKAGLKQQRRALRVIPQSLEWSLPKDDCLQLRFDLPSGAFATALLRELVNVDS